VAPKVTRKDYTETYSCEGQISCKHYITWVLHIQTPV